MPTKFNINSNMFLKKNIIGYHNTYYRGFGEPENPDYLNYLKNTFNKEKADVLKESAKMVMDAITGDIPAIMLERKLSDCIAACVPRAKKLDTYEDNQLLFSAAVKCAVSKIKKVEYVQNAITRHTNTKTTHLKSTTNRIMRGGNSEENGGEEPYPGITIATCDINQCVNGKDIILIDDIYTVSINIVEDCIQALLDSGANNVIFYSIAYTKRHA